MSSITGVAVIGTYTSGLVGANAAALAALIPNIDANRLTGTGAIAGGTGGGTFPGHLNSYLDEMSSACAVQLQVELAAMIAASPPTGYGQYVATAGDATATFMNIPTGLAAITLANCAATIRRAGTDVTADAVLSSPGAGVLRVTHGGATYVVTAGDVVTWIAQ